MKTQDIIDICVAKPGAYLDCPFGPDLVCARIGKRIFAEIFLKRPWITLKCDAVYGQAMRVAYPDHIRRGYHCPTLQHPYNNTVTLDGTVPDEQLLAMVDHSYLRALQAQTKAQQITALARQPADPDSKA